MTLHKIALLGALATTICLPGVVQAANTAAAPTAHAGGVDTDARCMAVGLVMTSSEDARTRSIGAQTLTYYYGRTLGRASKGDLETRIAAQFVALRAEKPTQPSAAQKCVNDMEASLVQLKPVMEHLGQRFGRPAPAAGAAAPAAPSALAPAPAH